METNNVLKVYQHCARPDNQSWFMLNSLDSWSMFISIKLLLNDN